MSPNFKKIAFAVLILCGSSSVCAQQRLPIIDGSRVPSSDYPAVAVVFPGDSLCTGTLVSPRHVLTAAHCFYDDHDRRVVGDSGTAVILGGQSYTSVKVYVHPTYVSRSEACVENE